jgi:predicted  nucleic acid-binding Zn-ribbon protein
MKCPKCKAEVSDLQELKRHLTQAHGGWSDADLPKHEEMKPVKPAKESEEEELTKGATLFAQLQTAGSPARDFLDELETLDRVRQHLLEKVGEVEKEQGSTSIFEQVFDTRKFRELRGEKARLRETLEAVNAKIDEVIEKVLASPEEQKPVAGKGKRGTESPKTLADSLQGI